MVGNTLARRQEVISNFVYICALVCVCTSVYLSDSNHWHILFFYYIEGEKWVNIMEMMMTVFDFFGFNSYRNKWVNCFFLKLCAYVTMYFWHTCSQHCKYPVCVRAAGLCFQSRLFVYICMSTKNRLFSALQLENVMLSVICCLLFEFKHGLLHPASYTDGATHGF